MPRRGKRGAIAAALGVAGVLILAAFFWRELAEAYHLYRLGASPGYLQTIAAAGEDSPRGLALRRFVRTPEGAAELIDAVLDVWSGGSSEGRRGALDQSGILLAVPGVWTFWYVPGRDVVRSGARPDWSRSFRSDGEYTLGATQRSGRPRDVDTALLRRLLLLLPLAAGTRGQLRSRPGIAFSVEPPDSEPFGAYWYSPPEPMVILRTTAIAPMLDERS